MDKRGVFLIFLIINLVLSISLVSALTGFTDQQELWFTGDQGTLSSVYQDGLGGNLDVNIELCDEGSSRYVGAFYAMNVEGSYNYVLVTNKNNYQALDLASTSLGGDCYASTTLMVAPSPYTVTSPDVHIAAFPGNLWIGHASSTNPASISGNDLIYANERAKLLGHYDFSRTFDESDQTIEIPNVPRVLYEKKTSSFYAYLDEEYFDLTENRSIVIGVCDENDYGSSCSDGTIMTSPNFPISFDTGLSAIEVTDQQIHVKNVVINGLQNPICIGANLNIEDSLLSVSPDPVYYNQTLNISFTIRNPTNEPSSYNSQGYGGNVRVTNPFDVTITIYNRSNPVDVVFADVVQIADTFLPGGENSYVYQWQALAHSGFYTVKVEVDSNDDIAECYEVASDNDATENFELKPITLPQIYIDGERTDDFERPNIPYNLHFYFKNSDNNTLRNASVTLTEENGLSLTAPTQIYNKTINASNGTEKSGIKSQINTIFTTDYFGNASFTFIPTYNKFFSDQYDYLGIEDYIDEYDLYFTGYQDDGEEFKFVIDGDLVSEYPLNITNITFEDADEFKELYHEDIAAQTMDFIYHTFTNFLLTIR